MPRPIRPVKKPAPKNSIKRMARPRVTVPRIKLRISKAIDVLVERVPEEAFSVGEKDILRRVQEKVSGSVYDTRLTEADFTNMKKIAKRHGIKFP